MRITTINRATLGVSLAILLEIGLLISGCGDERVPPAANVEPGYSETIVLWLDEPSGGNQIAAEFDVDRPLAPILLPGVDHPARLTLVAYIVPESDIGRFEEIRSDSLPHVNGKVGVYQGAMETLLGRLDSLFSIDTAFTNRACPKLGPCTACPCTMYTGQSWCGVDTCGSALLRAQLIADSLMLYDTLTVWRKYQERLIYERDSIAAVVDNRYRLALWFDDPNATPIYPEAVFTAADRLAGQEIYLAETDSLTGTKGKRFALDMDLIRAADPLPDNQGYLYEVNWTTCFAGSVHCLRPGAHTLYARLEGASTTRITGTIVLVYSGEQP